MTIWRRRLKCEEWTETVRDRLDRELGSLQERTETINRKRKQTQEESADKLYNTQRQVLELQMKNYQIEVSVSWADEGKKTCEALEKRMKLNE